MQAVADHGDEGVGFELRLGAPFFGAAAGMHENHAGVAAWAQTRGHLRIPQKSADVVDDLRAGRQGRARGCGFVGVDGKDRVGPRAQDSFKHGKQAGLLFASADGGRIGRCGKIAGARTGPGALRAQVEDVGAFVEQLHGAGHGRLSVEKRTTIAEGVGGDVDHAHDQRPRAQLDRARAQLPGRCHALRSLNPIHPTCFPRLTSKRCLDSMRLPAHANCR